MKNQKNIVISIIASLIEVLIVLLFIVLATRSDAIQEYKMIVGHYKNAQIATESFLEDKYDIDVALKTWRPETYSVLIDFVDGYYFTYSHGEQDIHVYISNPRKVIADDYEVQRVKDDIVGGIIQEIRSFSQAEVKVEVDSIGIEANDDWYLTSKYRNDIFEVLPNDNMTNLGIYITVYNMSEKDFENVNRYIKDAYSGHERNISILVRNKVSDSYINKNIINIKNNDIEIIDCMEE